jgi:arsenate reductase
MKILFMCTANSCRSQIAEAWARLLLPPDWEVQSAGLVTYPISERTRAVMAEVGLDMAGQRSKTYDHLPLEEFDLVVTLSEDAGRFLPAGIPPPRHWRRPLPDPMAAVGSDDEVMGAFREARDKIRDLVASLAGAARQWPAGTPDDAVS